MIALGKSTLDEMFLMVTEKIDAMEQAKTIIIGGGDTSLVIENYKKIGAASRLHFKRMESFTFGASMIDCSAHLAGDLRRSGPAPIPSNPIVMMLDNWNEADLMQIADTSAFSPILTAGLAVGSSSQESAFSQNIGLVLAFAFGSHATSRR